jgi:hypothetical protein
MGGRGRSRARVTVVVKTVLEEEQPVTLRLRVIEEKHQLDGRCFGLMTKSWVQCPPIEPTSPKDCARR